MAEIPRNLKPIRVFEFVGRNGGGRGASAEPGLPRRRPIRRIVRWVVDKWHAGVHWLGRSARSKLYASIVTLLLAVVGVAGSVRADQIGHAFPFIWPWIGLHFRPFALSWPYGGWVWSAAVFWLFVLATGFVFAVRQWADDTARREATETLERLVRTLPGPAFLTSFWDLYCVADEAGSAALDGGADVETVKAAIRRVLRCVALLAREYDGRPPNISYAANLMLYRPTGTFLDGEWPHIRARLRLEPGVALEDITGVLDLRLDLSATASSAEAEPDGDLLPLALSIKSEPTRVLPPDYRLRWAILPGAPIAFVRREADHFVDTTGLMEWCRENGLYSEEVPVLMAEYFRPDTKPFVGSWLSLPVTGKDPEVQAIAVLNVHRSERGLLREGDGAAEHFVPLAQPLQALLHRLLTRLSELEAPRPTAEPPAGEEPVTAT